MGAMEVPGEKKGASETAVSMHRPPSVEDLFAPMYRLDVQSSGAASRPGTLAPAAGLRAGSNAGQRSASNTRNLVLSAPTASTRGGDEGSNYQDVTQSAITMEQLDHEESYVGGSERGGDTNFSSGKGIPEAHSNSTSDDDHDQLVVDERKQKRMLSNRESARRSRLRKQQHLDELRAQVAHLRAENNHVLNRFSLASQQYAQLTDENCVLRSNAMDLSRQLQRLHHTAAGHHQVPLQPVGLNSGDPLPLNLTLRSGRSDDVNWGGQPPYP